MKNITSINNALKKLEEKQLKIAKELEELSLKRNQKLIDLLGKIPSPTPIETIIGGILHVIETINKNAKEQEDWFKAGSMFLQGKKPSQDKASSKKG
ncbi:MAG: hypothetical protein FJX18_07405 [Alphaproteobacteria bacterium]|nr:hypothetical protein [Alphaproteobacteria bacterium]